MGIRGGAKAREPIMSPSHTFQELPRRRRASSRRGRRFRPECTRARRRRGRGARRPGNAAVPRQPVEAEVAEGVAARRRQVLPSCDRDTSAPRTHVTTPSTLALTLPPTKQVRHRSNPRYQTRGLVPAFGSSTSSPSRSAFSAMARSSSFTVSKTSVGHACWQRGRDQPWSSRWASKIQACGTCRSSFQTMAL